MRIKELRIEKGLKQKEIAKMLNKTITCICDWERGRTQPSIDDLIKLSKIFTCSVDYIIENESEDGVIVISESSDSYTEDERELINEYNSLSSQEKNKVKGYIAGLKASQASINKKQA